MADKQRKYSRRVVLAGIIGAGAIGVGTASAIDTEIFPTVRVSYGEVSYESSSVSVTDYQLNGPGTNVTEVVVDLQNAATETIDVEIDVYLMDSGSVVESGSGTASVPGESSTSSTVSVPKTQENKFGEIEIRVTEV